MKNEEYEVYLVKFYLDYLIFIVMKIIIGFVFMF